MSWEAAPARRRARRRGPRAPQQGCGGDPLSLLLLRGGARLAADLCRVAAGARPAALLDYVGAVGEGTAGALAAACAARGAGGVEAWVLAEGLVYAVNAAEADALCCAGGGDGEAAATPRTVALRPGAPPAWGGRGGDARLAAALGALGGAAREARTQPPHNSQGAAAAPLDLRAACGAACAAHGIALPALSGALLGYPVVYAFEPTSQGASAAATSLAGGVALFTARAEPAGSERGGGGEAATIAAFSVPSELCAAGADEPWAREWARRLRRFDGQLWQGAELRVGVAPSHRLVL